MSMVIDLFPYLVAAWLAVIGLYGMATSRNLIHLVMCFSIFQSSVWVLLLAVSFHRNGTAPIFDDVPKEVVNVDPVMQAITITDIVVGAAVLAILLALTIHLHKRFGSLDPKDFNAIKG